jgi:hypothetical protein
MGGLGKQARASARHAKSLASWPLSRLIVVRTEPELKGNHDDLSKLLRRAKGLRREPEQALPAREGSAEQPEPFRHLHSFSAHDQNLSRQSVAATVGGLVVEHDDFNTQTGDHSQAGEQMFAKGLPLILYRGKRR